jgi:hypothetical protein
MLLRPRPLRHRSGCMSKMKDEALRIAEEQIENELEEQIRYMNAGISKETLARMKSYIANATPKETND